MHSIAAMKTASLAALLGAFLLALDANSQVAIDATDFEIIEALVPELNDLRLLTMQDLTNEQTANIGDAAEVERRFEGDFNADGQRDLVLFGSSASGPFVLLATSDAAVWHRSGLLRFDRPFIVGRADHDVLRVFFCTGCDAGMRVVWTGVGYELAPFPPVGVSE